MLKLFSICTLTRRSNERAPQKVLRLDDKDREFLCVLRESRAYLQVPRFLQNKSHHTNNSCKQHLSSKSCKSKACWCRFAEQRVNSVLTIETSHGKNLLQLLKEGNAGWKWSRLELLPDTGNGNPPTAPPPTPREGNHARRKEKRARKPKTRWFSLAKSRFFPHFLFFFTGKNEIFQLYR